MITYYPRLHTHFQNSCRRNMSKNIGNFQNKTFFDDNCSLKIFTDNSHSVTHFETHE